MINPNINERWDIEKGLNHPSLQNGESHDKEKNKIVISYLSKFVKSLQLSKAGGSDITLFFQILLHRLIRL